MAADAQRTGFCDELMGLLVTRSLTGRRYPAQMSVCEGSGAEPMAIRVLVNGVIEAGADAYGYRAACAW